MNTRDNFIDNAIKAMPKFPFDWNLINDELINESYLIRFWIIAPPALFGILAPKIKVHTFNNPQYRDLPKNKAREFWRQYKKMKLIKAIYDKK